MEDIPESITDKWSELDEKFYEYPENLTGLIIDYVKNNKSQFE